MVHLFFKKIDPRSDTERAGSIPVLESSLVLNQNQDQLRGGRAYSLIREKGSKRSQREAVPRLFH